MDLPTGEVVELVPTEGQIPDLTVDASGQYRLWVEDGRLRWLIDDEISNLDGKFIAAAWVTAPE